MEQQWMEEHRLTFKLCSNFLRYPQQEWAENTDELREIVEDLEEEQITHHLEAFLSYVASTDYKALCENYVRWFDFTEKTTLYLTYGLFGDKRERGPAFVKLKMEFAKAGFYIHDDELPDYLPLILEFASVAEWKHVQKVFMIHKKAFDQLMTNLEKESNPYHHVLKACDKVISKILPLQDNQVNHNAG